MSPTKGTYRGSDKSVNGPTDRMYTLIGADRLIKSVPILKRLSKATFATPATTVASVAVPKFE
jgi:hypothetical protein